MAWDKKKSKSSKKRNMTGGSCGKTKTITSNMSGGGCGCDGNKVMLGGCGCDGNRSVLQTLKGGKRKLSKRRKTTKRK